MADDEIDPEEEMIWPRGGRDRSSGDRLYVALSRLDNLSGAFGVGARSRRRVWLREVKGSLSLSLSVRLSLEIVWSENRNVKQFLGQSLYFTVKWNDFPENSIFYTQPNTWWGVKWFPEMVWSQNKHTLSLSGVFCVWCNGWLSNWLCQISIKGYLLLIMC